MNYLLFFQVQILLVKIPFSAAVSSIKVVRLAVEQATRFSEVLLVFRHLELASLHLTQVRSAALD